MAEKKTTAATKVFIILFAVSVVINLVLAFFLLKPKKEPEWNAPKITESEAQQQGYNPEFMEMAMQIASDNAEKGYGPVGAVIVKDGKVIAAAGNDIHSSRQIYQHAEICTIREAEAALGKIYLKGCELYTSAQPCLLCESAIYSVGITKVYYAASVKETSVFKDFTDLYEYETIYSGKNLVESVGIQIPDATKAIEVWEEARSKK